MVKIVYCVVFSWCFFCTTLGFSQQELLLPLLEEGKASSNGVSTDSSLGGKIDSSPKEEKAQLLQFDIQTKMAQPDPYPLEKYKGTFLKEDLVTIRSEFMSKNLPIVKATLERWRQRQDNSFPAEAYLMLATIYDQIGVYPKALSTIDDGSAKTDKKALFILAKARILRHSGEYQKSLDLLNQISAKEKTIYPDFFFDKGLSFLYLKDYDQTIIYFRRYLGLVPDGEQSASVRRAVAWLLLARRGQLPKENDSSAKEKDLEKMVQMLVEKQAASDLGDLNQSITASVDDKSLNLIEKDLEDLEQYSNIAD